MTYLISFSLSKKEGIAKHGGLPLALALRFSGIKSMACFSGFLVFYWALFYPFFFSQFHFNVGFY